MTSLLAASEKQGVFDTDRRQLYHARVKGQPAIRLRPCAPGLAVLLLGIAATGCDRANPAPTSATTPAAHSSPTVASLVPAATDLLIGMGAKDHLVAVSNFDTPVTTSGLPRVGDYQQTDWEKIADLKPGLMVIQVAPSRLPPGLTQRADALGVRLLNVKINRLEDLFAASTQLGEGIGRADLSEAFNRKLHARLERVRKAASGRPPVRVLLCRDETAVYVVGRGNFVDDLLTIAGGTNVITGDNPWPSIDREALVALDPDVIVQLLPDAPQQVLETARRTWEALPQLRAVKGGRVRVVTVWYALQPGAQVGELADQLATLIHVP